MQHGVTWTDEDVSGYLATEKYDGCRGYWDGSNMWTRGGHRVKLPESWREALPAGVHLDGEVYDGIDGLYRCGSAVKFGRFRESMRFMVFDCPQSMGPYDDRLDYARRFQGGPINVVRCVRVSGLPEALTMLREIKSRGGEGLILRDRRLRCTPGRNPKILKLKNWIDDSCCQAKAGRNYTRGDIDKIIALRASSAS